MRLRDGLRRIRKYVLTNLRPPPYCENIERWCLWHPEACKSLLRLSDGRTMERRSPLAPTERSVHWFFEKHRVHTFPAQYLATISGARLTGANGLVILPDGKFAVEPVFLPVFCKRIILIAGIYRGRSSASKEATIRC